MRLSSIKSNEEEQGKVEEKEEGYGQEEDYEYGQENEEGVKKQRNVVRINKKVA